MTKGII